MAVIDDDSSMLGATKELLEACGFVTMTFASAEEFLDHGASSQVDCLLLDIHLGGMSGIELRHWPTFLRKPYSARQLVDAIEKAVL